MKRILIVCVLVFDVWVSGAQCLTNSLVINTGYDPVTNTAITPGANGGTPVIDPHWTVTLETPSIATAIALTGLIEVVPGANADVITPVGSWIGDPPGTPGGWLSCLNSNTYTTDGTGPTGTPYEMELTRTFRMCTDDSIVFDLYIANDNYMGATDVDGVPFGFSQPALAVAANFTSFTHYTKTLWLTAGTHSLNAFVDNYNESSPSSNPTGMNIHGTVASSSGLNSLVSETYPSCASYTCTSTCNAVDLPDSLHPCNGDVLTMPTTLTGTDSVLSITWSPASGLSSSTTLTPTLTVAPPSQYYDVTVKSLIPFNLVSNGDFSGGNTGFTSSYTWSAPPSTVLLEGHYSVYTDPHGVHTGFTSFGDHTTGTGAMMIINGGPTPTDVWCETIPVLPNTDYNFSAWIANCSSVTVPPDVPILQFKINGVLIGTPSTISSPPATWTNFFQTWNSGVNTTAAICIYDLNTTAAGNDFALDDISFQEICTAKDSVYVAIRIPDTTTSSWDTALCIASGPITLSGTPGYAGYLWSTGATSFNITAPASGNYWVYNNNNCATLVDSFHVHYFPLPVLNLGNDTAFCVDDSLALSSTQPAGTAYLWNTGSTADSIHVHASGTYWLQLDDGCIVSDSIHILLSPHPVVDLGPDTFNCTSSPVTLASSVSYTSPAYMWSSGETTPSIVVDTSCTYWLTVSQAGCSGADSINVTIIYDTFTLYNVDTAICLGNSVQARVTASPLATLLWLPTAGVPAYTTPSPLITPDTTALYSVHISIPGCPDKVASFFIDVQPNPHVYMGGNRSVCANDTLHLYAYVDPPWYTHYSFSWSPGQFLDDSTIQDPVFTPGDSTKFVVVVSTPVGCTSGDSALMVVHPANFASLDTTYQLCPGDTVQFVPHGGVSYTWHPGRYLNDSTLKSPVARPITSQTYSGVAVNEFGCLDTVQASVLVHPSGVINVGGSVILAPGESDTVKNQTNCTRFEWFPPAGLNDASIADPVITPEISTKYIITGRTEWGCYALDSLDVFIDASIQIAIPNAFTPDAGVNNVLYLLKRGIVTLRSFRVFDRWGNRVYSSSDINQGWDGNYNGKPQPFGVYVYEIDAVGADSKPFHKAGNVTLIR